MVTVASVLPLRALMLALPFIMLSSLAFAQERPVFIYPVDGQTLDHKGSYMFKVQPMGKAKLFSWHILQNSNQVASAITGNEFVIHPGTPAHNKIVPGRVGVQVSAFIEGEWTKSEYITI